MTADAGESNGRWPGAEVEERLTAAPGSQDDCKKRAVGEQEGGDDAGGRNQDDSPEKKVVPDSEDLRVYSLKSGGGDFGRVDEFSAVDDESALQAVTTTTTEEECPVEGCEPNKKKDEKRELIMDNGGSHQEQRVAVVLSSSMKAEAANATPDAAADEETKASGHADTEEVKNSGNDDTGELGSDCKAEDGTGMIVENGESVQLREIEDEAEMNAEPVPANDQGHLVEGSNNTTPATAADGCSEEKLESTVELGEDLSVENSVAEVDQVKEPVSVDGARELTSNSTASATDDGEENSPSADGVQQESIVDTDEVSSSSSGEDTTHEAPNSTVSAKDDAESVVSDEQESQKSEADGAEDSNSDPGEVTAHKVENGAAVAFETDRQVEEKQADAAESCRHTEAEAAAMVEEKLETPIASAVPNDHEQEEGQKQVPDTKREMEQEPEQELDAATADSEKLEPLTEVIQSANQQQQQDMSKGDMNDASACSEDGNGVRSTPIETKRTYASVVASGSQSYSRNHLTKFGHVAANSNSVVVRKPMTPRFTHDSNFTRVQQAQQLGEKTKSGNATIYGPQKHMVEEVAILQNNDHESQKQYTECHKQSTLKALTFDGRSLAPDTKAPSILVQSTIAMQPVTVIASEVKPESSKITDSSPFLPVEQKKKPAKPKSHSETTSQEPRKTIADVETNNESTDDFVKVRSRKRRSEKSIRKAEERSIKEEKLEKERIAAELKEKLRLEQIAKAQEAKERKQRRAEKAELRAEHRAQKEAEIKEKRRAKKAKKKALAAADTTEGGDDDAVELPTFEKNPTKIVEGPHVTAPTSSKKFRKSKCMEPLPLPLRNRSNRRMRTWMWALLTALVVVVLFLAGDYISTSTSKQQ